MVVVSFRDVLLLCADQSSTCIGNGHGILTYLAQGRIYLANIVKVVKPRTMLFLPFIITVNCLTEY